MDLSKLCEAEPLFAEMVDVRELPLSHKLLILALVMSRLENERRLPDESDGCSVPFLLKECQ